MKTSLSVTASKQCNSFVNSALSHHSQIHLGNIGRGVRHIGRAIKVHTHYRWGKGGLDWSAFMPSFTTRIPPAIIYLYLTSTCQSCPTFKSHTSCGRKRNNFQLIWPSPEPFLSYFLIRVPLWSTLKRAGGDNRSWDIFSWLGLFDAAVRTLGQPSVQWLCVLPVIVAWLFYPLLI